MYQTVQKALGEWAMKIKFICFHSEEWNKLACVKIWSKWWIWSFSHAREEVAGWERWRKGRQGEERMSRIWSGSSHKIWSCQSFYWNSKTEAFPQISFTLRLFIFLIFYILHSWFFHLFRNDQIFVEGRVLTVLSHAVHSSFDNKKVEQSWKEILKY